MRDQRRTETTDVVFTGAEDAGTEAGADADPLLALPYRGGPGIGYVVSLCAALL